MRSGPAAGIGAGAIGAPKADPGAGPLRLSFVVLALGLGHLLGRHPAVAVEVEAQETMRALGMELLQRDHAVVVPVEAIEAPRAGGDQACPASSPESAPVSFQGVMRGNQGGTLAL